MATTIALITGASKGIGFQTARQLGARGVTVLAGARDQARGVAAERALREDLRGGAHVRFVPLDVTDVASVREAASWIEKAYGHLDILVNNAGMAVGGGPPSETDLDAMREMFQVNVSSEVGSISAMTDPASPPAQMPASLAYPSSKTALNMGTALYAKELRDTPIKVNAANPGYTATDLNGHRGFRSAAEGAEVSVHLATLDPSGPSGLLWGYLWSPAAPTAPSPGRGIRGGGWFTVAVKSRAAARPEEKAARRSLPSVARRRSPAAWRRWPAGPGAARRGR